MFLTVSYQVPAASLLVFLDTIPHHTCLELGKACSESKFFHFRDRVNRDIVILFLQWLGGKLFGPPICRYYGDSLQGCAYDAIQTDGCECTPPRSRPISMSLTRTHAKSHTASGRGFLLFFPFPFFLFFFFFGGIPGGVAFRSTGQHVSSQRDGSGDPKE